MVAVKVRWSPSDGMATCVIGVGVVVCMRERVVGQELKTLRESLLHLHFKCIVGTRSVVSVVVTEIERNSGCLLYTSDAADE